MIDEWHVLTAGHCLHHPGPLVVIAILGLHNIYDPDGIQYSRASSWEIHHDYDPSTLTNDLAIITLSSPANFTSTVGIIPLNSNYTPPNTTVIDAGRGLTSDNATTLPADLQYAYFWTIPNPECSNYFVFTVEESRLCTKGEGITAACHGDSGSALIQMVNGIQTQVGLVNAGSARSCEMGYPVIYTRCVSFREWIDARASPEWV